MEMVPRNEKGSPKFLAHSYCLLVHDEEALQLLFLTA